MTTDAAELPEAGVSTPGAAARGDHAVDAARCRRGCRRLGRRGWLRWAWRQLTSMRTALVLLFLLALGAVPGSVFPQRGHEPGATSTRTCRSTRRSGRCCDRLGMFDVFGSPWFAAIYLLLFVSLARLRDPAHRLATPGRCGRARRPRRATSAAARAPRRTTTAAGPDAVVRGRAARR